MTPIYVYLHICTKNNWLDVVTNIINQIKLSGLYLHISKIKCFILGNLTSIPSILIDEKIIIVSQNTNCRLYERFTLNQLYDDCCKEDFRVLYIHSKGITKTHIPFVKDWVEYLLYFNLFKFKKIIEYLEDFDTVGVNLHKKPSIHYSGNFWWSKSSHIKTLPRYIGNNYNDPEFWITSKNTLCKYVSIFTSNVNHYKTPFPKNLYENKDLFIETISFETI
jgi:hypothetical protein